MKGERPMTTRRLARWSFCLLVMLIVCAGRPDAGHAQAKKGGTIVEAMGTEPTNLNPFKAARQPEYMVLRMIFEPLFAINPKMQIEPFLVESWKTSDDGLTWTFSLKKGIKFHDGTPLNAEAVKFSLEMHQKGSQGRFLKVIKATEVVNESTFAIKLNSRYPVFLSILANFNISIVSPTAYNKAPNDWGSKVIVGSGPLMFKEWRSGDRVVLVRNPTYAHGPAFLMNRGPAYVDEWVIRFLPEPATLIAELTAGGVDLSAYVSERDVNRVKGSPNTSLILAKSTAPIYLAVNTKKKPFDDVRMRRAMAHAVNAEAVIKAAMSEVGGPLYTPIAPTVVGFSPASEEVAKPHLTYDLNKSKQLLDELGWKEAKSGGVREKDGQPLEVVFFAFNIARYKRMAEVVTPMLQQAGFKVDLKILEAGDLYERTLKGEHDLLSTGLVGGQGFALDDLVSALHSSSLGTITQWCQYSNPELDKQLDLARYQPDPKVRTEALNAAQKIAAEALTVIPITNSLEIFGYRKSLGGVEDFAKHPWAFSQANGYRALEIYKK
jgi:peptide/nickel transport system substrate-binding protein